MINYIKFWLAKGLAELTAFILILLGIFLLFLILVGYAHCAKYWKRWKHKSPVIQQKER